MQITVTFYGRKMQQWTCSDRNVLAMCAKLAKMPRVAGVYPGGLAGPKAGHWYFRREHMAEASAALREIKAERIAAKSNGC